jgi:hypothetical protein
MIDGTPFRGLHYAGRNGRSTLDGSQSRQATMVLLAVFDTESSLGIVQLYLEELQANVARPHRRRSRRARAGRGFRAGLNRNLAQLFGRAG